MFSQGHHAVSGDLDVRYRCSSISQEYRVILAVSGHMSFPLSGFSFPLCHFAYQTAVRDIFLYRKAHIYNVRYVLPSPSSYYRQTVFRWWYILDVNKGGKTKRVNMWSVWKWMIALVFKVLGWSRGEWAAKTKRLHRFTLGLHLSLVWTPFKWNALHWRWDRGDFRSVVVDCSPWFTFSSYTKIVKRIGLYKWSGGVHGALFLFILSKLFHIDDIWYICNEINTVYYE